MRLSRASSYALHAVVYLAAPRSHSLVGSQDIARLLGITENRLVRILKSLVSTRILWSLRGRGGGYRLTRPASQISVLEVIEAIEGPVRGAVPSLSPLAHGPVARRLQLVCEHLAEWTRHVLAQLSIADLAANADRLAGAGFAFGRPVDGKQGLPPDVAEGLEEIRRLMAAREGDRRSRDEI
jgi:Rrf2 family protein